MSAVHWESVPCREDDDAERELPQELLLLWEVQAPSGFHPCLRRTSGRRVLQQLLQSDVRPIQSGKGLEQRRGHNQHQAFRVRSRVSKVSWSGLQGRGGDLKGSIFPSPLRNLCKMLSTVGHKIPLCRGGRGQGDLLPRLIPTKVPSNPADHTCSFQRPACLGGPSCLLTLQGKGF